MVSLPLAILLILPAFSLADPTHIPLTRRAGNWATHTNHLAAADFARARYGFGGAALNTTKRMQRRGGSAQGLPFVNQEGDSSYFGTVTIGTPCMQGPNIFLDTGSSDLWLADSACNNCDRSTPVYKPDTSTSFVQKSQVATQISYGSGMVAGFVSSESVSMGNFSLTNQGFLSVEQTSEGLLSGSVSGIMGLAFVAISSTQTTPFWQGLISASQLEEPLMAFWLTRFRGGNNVQEEEPGGAFTLGGTNSSLFQGDIEFINMAGPSTPHVLAAGWITVQGKTVNVATGDAALAAIDTGTTLIGGPTADVDAIWAAIPGSSKVGPTMPGYFQFPCTTTISISIAFGGKLWPIDPADMNLGPGQGTARSMCLGGLFDLTLGSNIEANSGNPTWVVGDTFLKNVYSVFRQNPLSVGFAQLSDLAGGSGAPGAGPSVPSGAKPASATSTSALVSLLVVALSTAFAQLF
ncbi:aspartyl protease [Mycena alexandri]|uniref:Aspartyl protease n=1 Tax=Mycena alexandri TaxID=1745969 RepID=A0AAD6WV93_9AGAR|nr:aspartyl protease [Mycena alexandri]